MRMHRSAWTLWPVALAATAIPAARGDVDCPVVGAGGNSTSDGSVFVVGQFAAGLVAAGATELDQGAVPCWATGEAPCPGDIDGDGSVGLTDLAVILANYGTPSGAGPEDGDLDGDGDVDLSDLAILLGAFGTICE